MTVVMGLISIARRSRRSGSIPDGRGLVVADRAGASRERAPVPGPLEGRELNVALEATTGWRFVVEDLRRRGAEVHLAEPAETADRRGRKKRAKTDWADARHLRELVMIGRLLASWIPPDRLLDLRACGCPTRL